MSVYFDNSATTSQKPKEVEKAVVLAVQNFSANPGRGGHSASNMAGLEVFKVREKIANFVGHKNPLDVIFTSGCTEALNMAIFGSAKPGHIICTENEHNSVLRPLQKLKDDGLITFSVARAFDGKVPSEEIERLILPNTYLVVCNHVSNVNGDVCDIQNIAHLCRSRGIKLLVDMAQSAGHKDIKMDEWGVDMIALAGHKGLYGIMGVGALILAEGMQLSPLLYGGTGINSQELFMPNVLPEKLEAGTLPLPAILAMGAGIDFVSQNKAFINNKIDDLQTYLHYELKKLDLKIYTHPDNTNGVFAFNIDDISSAEVANILNEKYGVCVRPGLHCAPLKHKALDTLNLGGCIRVSFSCYNTIFEVEHLISAIKHIKKI